MQQQILFKKAWAQAVKLLTTGKAEAPVFCMTASGIFFFSLEKKNPYPYELLRNTSGGAPTCQRVSKCLWQLPR